MAACCLQFASDVSKEITDYMFRVHHERHSVALKWATKLRRHLFCPFLLNPEHTEACGDGQEIDICGWHICVQLSGRHALLCGVRICQFSFREKNNLKLDFY